MHERLNVKKLHAQVRIMLIGEKMLFELCNVDFVSQLRPSKLLRLSLLLYENKDDVIDRDEF